MQSRLVPFIFCITMDLENRVIIPKYYKIQLTLTFDIARYLFAQSIADDHNTTEWFD